VKNLGPAAVMYGCAAHRRGTKGNCFPCGRSRNGRGLDEASPSGGAGLAL